MNRLLPSTLACNDSFGSSREESVPGGEGDDADLLLPGATAKALTIPAAQQAVGLVLQPAPGLFHHHPPHLAIAGLADPLLTLIVAAMIRRRRDAPAPGDLTPILEVAIADSFVCQQVAATRSDAFQIQQPTHSLDTMLLSCRHGSLLGLFH